MKKKSASNRIHKKNALLLAIAALALSTSGASATTTYWTLQGTGSWFDCTNNWSSGCPSCSPSIDAQINNGGTAQVNTDTPVAYAENLTLGYSTGNSGKVSVDGTNGGTLDICNNAFIGDQGAGSFSVTNGGTVTVSGEADVGTSATGLLSVTSSGTVSAGSVVVGGSGTLTGNGTVSTTNGTFIYGTIEPNWTLTIGGALTIETLGTMQCNVTPQDLNGIDLHVTAVASLSGRLSVTMTGTFTPGTTYTLLKADGGRIDVFTLVSINYPTNQCFTPAIQYDTNNVKLYLEANCW